MQCSQIFSNYYEKSYSNFTKKIFLIFKEKIFANKILTFPAIKIAHFYSNLIFLSSEIRERGFKMPKTENSGLFIITITLLISLFASCKTTEINKQSHYSNEVKDTYVLFLKKQLPLVRKNMTFKDVGNFLQFEQKFNGIVTSGGKRSDFKYYYQLIGYQLILSFDYGQYQGGKFISYQLKPLS